MVFRFDAGLAGRSEDPPKKEDAGLAARISPSRRFGWGDSNRRDLQGKAFSSEVATGPRREMRKSKAWSSSSRGCSGAAYIIQ